MVVVFVKYNNCVAPPCWIFEAEEAWSEKIIVTVFAHFKIIATAG